MIQQRVILSREAHYAIRHVQQQAGYARFDEVLGWFVLGAVAGRKGCGQ